MQDTDAEAAMCSGTPHFPTHGSARIVSRGVQLKHTSLVDTAKMAELMTQKETFLENSTAKTAMGNWNRNRNWICMAILVGILEKDWLRNMALLVRILWVLE